MQVPDCLHSHKHFWVVAKQSSVLTKSLFGLVCLKFTGKLTSIIKLTVSPLAILLGSKETILIKMEKKR